MRQQVYNKSYEKMLPNQLNFETNSFYNSTPIWRSWFSNAIGCSSLQVLGPQLEEFDTCNCINITIKKIILLFYRVYNYKSAKIIRDEKLRIV